MITYQYFFLFCTFIVAIVSLLVQIFKVYLANTAKIQAGIKPDEQKILPAGISLRKDGRYMWRFKCNGQQYTGYTKTLAEAKIPAAFLFEIL